MAILKEGCKIASPQGDAYLPLITWSLSPPADAGGESDHHRGKPVAFPRDVIQTPSCGHSLEAGPTGGRGLNCGRTTATVADTTPSLARLRYADAGRDRERRYRPRLGLGPPAPCACGPRHCRGLRVLGLRLRVDASPALPPAGACRMLRSIWPEERAVVAGIPRLAQRWSERRHSPPDCGLKRGGLRELPRARKSFGPPPRSFHLIGFPLIRGIAGTGAGATLESPWPGTRRQSRRRFPRPAWNSPARN